MIGVMYLKEGQLRAGLSPTSWACLADAYLKEGVVEQKHLLLRDLEVKKSSVPLIVPFI